MNVLWAGTEPDTFYGTPAMAVTTSSAQYDANFSRAACNVQGGPWQVCPSLGNQATVGYRLRFGASGGVEATGRSIIEFRNAANQGVLRVRQAVSGSQWTLQYWSGSAWVSIGSNRTVSPGSSFYDIYCKIHASAGVMSWYENGTLLDTLTGNTNFFSSSVDSIWISGYDSFVPVYTSEHIIADDLTLSLRCATLPISGAGTTTNWTSGTYADVDESDVNDADYISSAVANQVDTFALSDLSATAAALTPVAVCVNSRARNAATGPQNLQPAIRTHAVDYFGSNVPALTTSFQSGRGGVWNVNPNTGLAWTVSEINALEAGVKSIA